jgi:DNA-binding transcriptional MerR regulator
MVSQDVISKKELLEETGISYGQLYRWKRKNIIPESWFIKKSSYTGQETYFPKEKILERIQKIIEMKDTHSLDELSDFFSPNPTEVKLTLEMLLVNKVIQKETIEVWSMVVPLTETFQFHAILSMYIIEQLLQKKMVSIEECREAITFLSKKELLGDLIGIRKNNTLVWMLVRSKSDLVIEDVANIIVEMNMLVNMNDLKIKLSEIGY